MDNSVTVNVQVMGTSHIGRVDVSTLNGASPFSENTEANPDAVAITETNVQVHGDTLTYAFPAHSVTVFTIHPGSEAGKGK
jgi:alpha-L-arabinofuranosidase